MSRRSSSGATDEAVPFLAGFAGLERTLLAQGPAWLRRLRASARTRFESQGFPSTRLEAWKNTNVSAIARTAFSPPPSVDPRSLATHPLFDTLAGAPRLVFVDGRHAPALSSPGALPAGVLAVGLAHALLRLPERLEPLLTRRAPESAAAFEALNLAFAEDGAVILVDDDVVCSEPLHVIHVARGGPEPHAVQPRTIVALGRHSRLQLVESYVGSGPGPYLTNALSDIALGDGAILEHVRLQLEGAQAFHVSTSESRQGRDSRYDAFNLDLGGALVRHDIVAVLDGEGGYCNLDGLVVAGATQHVDNQTTLDHARAHCGSREVYKCILDGSSRSVFNGRIIVRPGAQKTDAKQSNPNLLLSRDALAHTRPQLEIYADDVKCTHGATIGRLDEDSVFYLRSRGIPDRQARELLVSAFAGEILERVSPASLRDRLLASVAERLALGRAERP